LNYLINNAGTDLGVSRLEETQLRGLAKRFMSLNVDVCFLMAMDVVRAS